MHLPSGYALHTIFFLHIVCGKNQKQLFWSNKTNEIKKKKEITNIKQKIRPIWIRSLFALAMVTLRMGRSAPPVLDSFAFHLRWKWQPVWLKTSTILQIHRKIYLFDDWHMTRYFRFRARVYISCSCLACCGVVRIRIRIRMTCSGKHLCS